MRKVNPNFVGVYANKGSKNNVFTYMTGRDTAEDVCHIDYLLPMFDQLNVGDRFQIYLLNDQNEASRFIDYVIVKKDVPLRKLYKRRLKFVQLTPAKEDNVEDDGV